MIIMMVIIIIIIKMILIIVNDNQAHNTNAQHKALCRGKHDWWSTF